MASLGKDYADREVIVRQGEPGNCMYVVQEGQVEAIAESDGREMRLRTLGPNDFFGEMALLHGMVRTATCRAVTPCALYEFARADLDSVLETCPAMSEALAEADRRRREELLEAGADIG